MLSTEIFVAFITVVIGPILVIFINKKIGGNKSNPDLVNEAIKSSEIVRLKLENIMKEFLPDRIWVTQFHNGGNFYPSGKSMTKFSLNYEVVNSGIESVQQKFQNVPVSLFSRGMNYLFENSMILIPDCKSEEADTFGLRYFIDEGGLKSCYLVGIKSIDGKFIGVLGLDYVKRKTKLTDEDMNHILNYASLISGNLISRM